MPMNYDYIKRDPKSFYNNVGMYGERTAYERVNMLNSILKDKRYNSTKIQKWIIKNALSFDKDLTWHYFFHTADKKYVGQVKHILKKLNKTNGVSELSWIESRTGLLRTPLTKTLHVFAYNTDRKKYVYGNSHYYVFLGMIRPDAEKRAIDMVKSFEKKYPYDL